MNNLIKPIAIGVGLLLGVYILKAVSQPKLNNFKPSEFGTWWPLMSPKLLKTMDKFRELTGSPVFISPVEGGLGRFGGDSHSQHNVDMWGEVKAADMFPTVPANNAKGWKLVETEEERQFIYEKALEAGFTGIGLYTDTIYNNQTANMLHGDVREDRTEANPALWSRVDRKYYGIDEVV